MMRKKAVLILTYGPFYQKLTKFYDHLCPWEKMCISNSNIEYSRKLSINSNHNIDAV